MESMALQSLFSTTLTIPPRIRSSAAYPVLRRRAPLVGALWVLSIGALRALSYKLPTISRLKFANQLVACARDLHSSSSSAMESAASNNVVPSIVVYVTVPNKEAGKKLAESIIKEKLAACVNRVPGIESVYWWDGKVQTDSEELLIIKTRESLLNALTEHVKSNHEYEVPEVISLPITSGNPKYLEWIKNNTRGD